MRFMLIQTYGRGNETTLPITEWSPEDLATHIEFQQLLNEERTRLGELVGAEGLASPEAAKFVVCDDALPRDQHPRARPPATPPGAAPVGVRNSGLLCLGAHPHWRFKQQMLAGIPQL